MRETSFKKLKNKSFFSKNKLATCHKNLKEFLLLKYSQPCVKRPPLGPKIVAVVYRWSLFRGHERNKSFK